MPTSGPRSADRGWLVPDPVVDQARATTRRVGRTFALACRLLPRGVRDDVYLLYLVFRTLDDLVDSRDPRAEARIAAVEAWADLRPAQSPETDLLSALETRHRLPRYALADFCAGMRDDLSRHPIDTEVELDLYCYRVAGTVGLTMAAVLGVNDEPRALPAAIALGQAMQRTNILRDIDEDRDEGRCYLARETIDRFGQPLPGQREGLLRDQIARADALYERGRAGVHLLSCGNYAIAAAARMYREILREIERDGYGAHAGRAVVPTPRKLLLMAGAGGRRPSTPRASGPPLSRRCIRPTVRTPAEPLAPVHPADDERVGDRQTEYHRQ
jgi:phytoene synthase